MAYQRNALASHLSGAVNKHKNHQAELATSMQMVLEAGKHMEQLGLDPSDVRTALDALIKLDTTIGERVSVLEPYARGFKNLPSEGLADTVEAEFMAAEGKRPATFLQDHPMADKYKRAIWAISHPDEPLPEEANDELVLMSQASATNIVCPLTATVMEQPVKNPPCGHTYSKAAITQLVGRRGVSNCPVPGCGHRVALADLIPDADVAAEIAQRSRAGTQRSQMVMDEDDVEDVI